MHVTSDYIHPYRSERVSRCLSAVEQGGTDGSQTTRRCRWGAAGPLPEPETGHGGRPRPRRRPIMTDIQKRVQQAIDRLVESGAERGLQVAAYRNGELVVDAVAGDADPETGRPVTSDTLFFSYSIGKGVASTVVHVLAERGILDYDTRIVELWPEFGVHGKESATVRHALSQSVGVPGLPSGLTAEDLTDWEKMCAIIADSAPWWEPGTKIGYHAITWGYV